MKVMFLGELSENLITIDETYGFTGHSHRHLWEIIIVISGAMGIRIGSSDFVLPPRRILILRPGLYHWFWAHTKPCSYYNCYFEADLPILSNHSCKPAYLGRKFTWYTNPHARNPEMETRMQRLLTLLQYLPKASADAKAGGVFSSAQTDDMIYSTIKQIATSSPSHMHTLQEIASAFPLQPNYLAAKVKAVTGQTVMQIYFQQKINTAHAMLSKGMRIQHISNALGFANPYHFSRKYREIMGRSPENDIKKA